MVKTGGSVLSTPRGDIGTSQQARADSLDARMQSRIDQPAIQVGPSYDGKEYANFPAKLIPKDNYDNVYATKWEQLNDPMYGEANVPKLTMPITREDIDYVERKRKVQEKLKFDNWMAHVIDLSNPTEGKSSSSKRLKSSSSKNIKKRPSAAKLKGKPMKKIGKGSRSYSASAHRKGKGSAR